MLWCTWSAAFRDEAVAHAAGGIDPGRDAQAMEDELILADLGVVERLERLDKDLKKNKSAELEKERDLICAARRRSRTASRCGRSA